jgi:hypothetical protein
VWFSNAVMKSWPTFQNAQFWQTRLWSHDVCTFDNGTVGGSLTLRLNTLIMVGQNKHDSQCCEGKWINSHLSWLLKSSLACRESSFRNWEYIQTIPQIMRQHNTYCQEHQQPSSGCTEENTKSWHTTAKCSIRSQTL